METLSRMIMSNPFVSVLILPMRNGNSVVIGFSFLLNIFVLILPMRNGNLVLLVSFEFSVLRSYPTYEEWKQMICFKTDIESFVLILPMRNGNTSQPNQDF